MIKLIVWMLIIGFVLILAFGIPKSVEDVKENFATMKENFGIVKEKVSDIKTENFTNTNQTNKLLEEK